MPVAGVPVLPTRDLLDYIKIYAELGFSLLAFATALVSLLYSRRAIRLTETELEQKRPRIELYYEDGYLQHDAPGAKRWLVFKVIVKNRSSSANAVADIELRLAYSVDRYRHVYKSRPTGRDLDHEITIGSKLDAYEARSGWIWFSIGYDTLAPDTKIDDYVLRVSDVHDNSNDIEITYLKEQS